MWEIEKIKAETEDLKERTEKYFDEKTPHIKIDDRHDLVVFGSGENAKERRNKHQAPKRNFLGLSEELPWEPRDIVIIDRQNKTVPVRIADLLREIDPDLSVVNEHPDQMGFFYYPTLDKISVPDAIEDKREVFKLFHEIGHAKSLSKMSRSEKKEVLSARVNLNKHSIPNRPGFPQCLDERTKKTAMQNERNAWANAIHLAKKIKLDHGIDLFKMFDGVDDFMGWLRADRLETYEKNLALPKTQTEKVKKHKLKERERIEAEELKRAREQMNEILGDLDGLKKEIAQDFADEKQPQNSSIA